MRRLTNEQYISKCIEKHGDTYDYTKTVYKNSRVKVIVTCNTHGDFSILASAHLKGKGCAWCAGNHKQDVTHFKKRARLIHGKLYSYKKSIYNGCMKNLIITCRTHGDFNQTPNQHYKGEGCPHYGCRYEKVSQKLRSNTETLISKSKEIHKDSDGNPKINYIHTEYGRNNLDKVWFTCIRHNYSFRQTPDGHLNDKNGCPVCGKDYMFGKLEKLIEFSNDKYGFNKFDFSKSEYLHCQKPIIIICNRHSRPHEFQTTPFAHKQSTYGGCDLCCHSFYSQKAIRWLEYIMERDKIDIQHAENMGEYLIPGTKYHADGYCKETNTVYEANECIWHGCIKCFNPDEINPMAKQLNIIIYDRTIKREEIIKSLGFNVVSVWGHDGTKQNFYKTDLTDNKE